MKAFADKVGSFRLARTTTSVERSKALCKELQRYAAHFQTIEKETQRWQKVVSGTFNSISDLMRSPMPNTYEETPEGEAVPSEVRWAIGDGVYVDGLTGAANHNAVQLEGVARSTQAWLKDFREVKDRVKTLKSLRKELQKAKSKAQSFRVKLDQLQMRTRTAKPGTNPQKDEMLMMQTEQQLQMAEHTVQSMERDYYNAESATYDTEVALAQRCPKLQGLTVNLIGVCKDTFSCACSAFAV